ncbi:hypothetical protein GCM10010353_42850 [Streptomyces chryseus]|nr:hypothetical protein GCM10010353_42850 [Streptomyces chryseus]
MDLAYDLAAVDQKQTFLPGPGITGDVGGEELDVAVREDPAPQPPAAPFAAPVPRPL